ncbi:hypothetical protein [Xanthomonas albilineans]|uniref:hypothetical protein n=1 Tax=Xanthomonas albilineans TaxID=29447 RepID=UPI0012D4BC9D|nr:hypothetical protein [Xanthomonas albilineans]
MSAVPVESFEEAARRLAADAIRSGMHRAVNGNSQRVWKTTVLCTGHRYPPTLSHRVQLA